MNKTSRPSLRRVFIAPRRTFRPPATTVSRKPLQQLAGATKPNTNTSTSKHTEDEDMRKNEPESVIKLATQYQVDKKVINVKKTKNTRQFKRKLSVLKDKHRCQVNAVKIQKPSTSEKGDMVSRVYTCLYHKYTTAKKKKYFDGFVILEPNHRRAKLFDEEGKLVAKHRTS